MFSVKNDKNFYYEDQNFASFATQWFSTLTTIFGLLEVVGSHKITKTFKGMRIIPLISMIFAEISTHKFK